jgi:hypothetical protein
VTPLSHDCPPSRDRTLLPESRLEREIISGFAEAVEAGDIDEMVALLTDDAWLTMPPLPHAYQGPAAIGAFMRAAEERRGIPLRLIPTRASGQPAYGCYAPAPGTNTLRAVALFVLTVERNQISAITWFAQDSLLPHFGLPRSLE